jgi:hypothetical protein
MLCACPGAPGSVEVGYPPSVFLPPQTLPMNDGTLKHPTTSNETGQGMGDAPESPASICCPDPASFAGAPPMQKINLDLLPTTAEQPRGFEQRDNDFTTGSSHVFPPSLSNLFSPATPSEGSRLPRDILQYNTAVCAILVLLPVALAFGGLELVYMLDQQAESSLHSTITIQHAAPAAMREVLQPTATMDEVQPATLLQPRTASAPLHSRMHVPRRSKECSSSSSRF